MLWIDPLHTEMPLRRILGIRITPLRRAPHTHRTDTLMRAFNARTAQGQSAARASHRGCTLPATAPCNCTLQLHPATAPCTCDPKQRQFLMPSCLAAPSRWLSKTLRKRLPLAVGPRFVFLHACGLCSLRFVAFGSATVGSATRAASLSSSFRLTHRLPHPTHTPSMVVFDCPSLTRLL
mgnify:CR=1 FL=1